ncbi:MAG TPA: hypothetical protein VEJ21_02610 [Acidimicrobiales bacterium]|nr:hypothetical protein [Acidimicrobiales bacterium]
MVALAVVLCAVVLLLAVLVAGLLRSHADILKALHDLGAGVGDPATPTAVSGRSPSRGTEVPPPLLMGPPLPEERDATTAPAVAGMTPNGDAVGVAPATGGGLTLLAFLSSGCGTCGGFWSAFRQPDRWGFPEETRLVVVTKGPEYEVPRAVAELAAPGLTVVMSSEAWSDYEVPGSPFFVLVDGRSGRRIGEGVANHLSQVAELVRRAVLDARSSLSSSRGRASAEGLDGPARERANDQELLRAGVLPGDPSLYPRTFDDLYGPDGPTAAPRPPAAGAV